MTPQTEADDAAQRLALREHLRRSPTKPKPLIDGLHRDLPHGWLLEYLFRIDGMLNGRWNYWAKLNLSGSLPAEGIPKLEWEKGASARAMLERSLDCIPRIGFWQTWGSWDYFRYFLDWLLYGFGHAGHPEVPKEPGGCEGASDRLYQVFDLGELLLWPFDYFGDLLAETSYGQGQGFFPTPLHICEMMAQVSFGSEDGRLKTTLDPCVGTGRMLLAASNYSLRLYAQDIDATMCSTTLVNAYIYAPWLALPLPWLDAALLPEHSAELSERITASAPPQAQEYLSDSEHDAAEQWRYEPVKKRRRKGERVELQGALFD